MVADGNGDPEQGKPEFVFELSDVMAVLENVISVLDAAGENVAAAHVDMARHVLASRAM